MDAWRYVLQLIVDVEKCFFLRDVVVGPWVVCKKSAHVREHSSASLGT